MAIVMDIKSRVAAAVALKQSGDSSVSTPHGLAESMLEAYSEASSLGSVSELDEQTVRTMIVVFGEAMRFPQMFTKVSDVSWALSSNDAQGTNLFTGDEVFLIAANANIRVVVFGD